MKYFVYFSRIGKFIVIENPDSEFDYDAFTSDIAFSFGYIEAENKEEVENKCQKILADRIKI